MINDLRRTGRRCRWCRRHGPITSRSVLQAVVDIRDLAQVLAHIHDAAIEISEGPEPPRAGRPRFHAKGR